MPASDQRDKKIRWPVKMDFKAGFKLHSPESARCHQPGL